jgi:DNA-binding transcriptional LysR family regulator
MDHRQLAFLCALARERHFGRAAVACNVTQPTLSARIKQLEEELGTPLIRRGRRFEGLTAEGERVLKHARMILDEFDALRSELDADVPIFGRLSIGSVPSALEEATAFMPRLRKAHPGLAVMLRELPTGALAQGLETGQLDIALGYLDSPAMAGFAHRPLYQEFPALVASPQHFQIPERPEWNDLTRYPLCLLTPEMQQRRLLDAHLLDSGLAVSPLFETDSIATLGELLHGGLGVTVLSDRLVPQWASMNLAVRRLPGSGARMGLLWRAGHPRNRHLEAALEVWRGAIAERGAA